MSGDCGSVFVHVVPIGEAASINVLAGVALMGEWMSWTIDNDIFCWSDDLALLVFVSQATEEVDVLGWTLFS